MARWHLTLTQSVESQHPHTGQLACQKDSYLRTLRATVLSCVAVEVTAPPAEKTTKKKKGKKQDGGGGDGGAEIATVGPQWHVGLSDTVLFPEGGGQPADRGTVGGVDCVDVQVADGFAVHTLAGPLDLGASVDIAVDWTRRWDHMQQHTGQHLITAIAVEMFGFPTVAWHLGPDSTSTLDLDTAGTPFTDTMLAELETAVNGRVRDAHPITPKWIAPKDPEMATIRRNKDLPDDVVGDVRVLTIDGVDKNLCCGTHVNTTAHLATVKLLRAEKVKKVTRVHFAVGDRLLALAGAMFTRQLALTSALTSAPEHHLDQVVRPQSTPLVYACPWERGLAIKIKVQWGLQRGAVFYRVVSIYCRWPRSRERHATQTSGPKHSGANSPR